MPLVPAARPDGWRCARPRALLERRADLLLRRSVATVLPWAANCGWSPSSRTGIRWPSRWPTFRARCRSSLAADAPGCGARGGADCVFRRQAELSGITGGKSAYRAFERGADYLGSLKLKVVLNSMSH